VRFRGAARSGRRGDERSQGFVGRISTNKRAMSDQPIAGEKPTSQDQSRRGCRITSGLPMTHLEGLVGVLAPASRGVAKQRILVSGRTKYAMRYRLRS
jgi:hypothetical protein